MSSVCSPRILTPTESDRQLFFFTLPALDMIPANLIKPLRNVVTFAVDEQHVRRPLARPDIQGDPVDFCIIKRTSISLFSLRDKLTYWKVCSPITASPPLLRR